jgi:hypothetical protein
MMITTYDDLSDRFIIFPVLKHTLPVTDNDHLVVTLQQN